MKKKKKKENKYPVNSYYIGNWCGEENVILVQRNREKNLWSITTGQTVCFDKVQKDWIVEPLNSYKTEDFYKRCSFSLEEGFDTIEKFKLSIIGIQRF